MPSCVFLADEVVCAVGIVALLVVLVVVVLVVGVGAGLSCLDLESTLELSLRLLLFSLPASEVDDVAPPSFVVVAGFALGPLRGLIQVIDGSENIVDRALGQNRLTL